MKIKVLIGIIVLVFNSLNTFAFWESSYLKNYDWTTSRSRYELTEKEKNLPELVIQHSTTYEYVYEGALLSMYYMEHNIIYVNSDNAIEQSNKIKIPYNNIINIKARSISPNGKIIEVDKNNIKEIKNNKNSTYKVFAIEGIEKGSEVEYFYVVKLGYSIANAAYFQFDIPVKHAFFSLIAPKKLEFKLKGYNNFPVIKDTIVNGRCLYSAQADNIEEISKEKYAFPHKYKMRVEFKITHNPKNYYETDEVNSWDDLATKEYNEIYKLSWWEKRNAKKLFKSFNINDNANNDEKIRIIENYIKSNIVIQNVYSADYSNVKYVIKNRFGNRIGITKLYSYLFKLAGIDAQLCLTSDRSELEFDKNFSSLRYLNYFLFYFPTTQKYLTPENVFFRYPLIPSVLTNTYGLFIKEVLKNGFNAASPLVKFIEPLDDKSNIEKLDEDINFTNNFDSVYFKIENSLRGYYGIMIQPFYAISPENKRKTMLENYMKRFVKDGSFNIY